MTGRLKLKSIYPTFDDFKTYCQNVVGEFYPQIIDMVGFGNIVEEMNRYVYLPIYRQFKNATCRYLPTEDGIEAFNNQFANQLEEVVFDFLIYTSTNISYFNEAYNNVGQNLEQGVSTFNNPINQDIKNTKSNTVIADGATSQSINLMIYNGKTSWRKAFSSYYTPQRKAELIDRFRWLFISFYVGCEEGVTLIELTEALSMADGDMIITPEEAEILRKVIIEKPSTLIPENIKKGVDIGGVIGTLEEGGGTNMNKITYELSNIDFSNSDYGEYIIDLDVYYKEDFIGFLNNDFLQLKVIINGEVNQDGTTAYAKAILLENSSGEASLFGTNALERNFGGTIGKSYTGTEYTYTPLSLNLNITNVAIHIRICAEYCGILTNLINLGGPFTITFEGVVYE